MSKQVLHDQLLNGLLMAGNAGRIAIAILGFLLGTIAMTIDLIHSISMGCES